MINRINIHSGIRRIADEIFITNEISNGDIDIFVNDIAKFIMNEFDAYVSQNERKLICFIPENKQELFKDFTNGYVRKMQEWMDENPVVKKTIEIPVEQIVEQMPNNEAIKKALSVASVGTIVAICLSFFTPTLVAIIGELIALGIAYRVYKKENNIKETRNVEPNIEEIKEQMINSVVKEASSWLDKAENKSNQLIESYR